jgi:hypothetical protein
MARDYIPQSHTQFNVFMRNIITYLNTKIEEWTGRVAGGYFTN